MIVCAQLKYHDELTAIAVAAKRHWNYPEAWMQAWLPSLMISPEYIETHEVWMAVMDDKPVAYYSFNEESGDLWLDNLWVLPEFMGQGIGKLLFGHALERCKVKGVSVLKIEADPNAQRFYEKMGALKTGEYVTEACGEPRILPIMEITI